MSLSDDIVTAVNLICQPLIEPPMAVTFAHSLINEKMAERLSVEDADYILSKLKNIAHPAWKTMIASAVVDFVSDKDIQQWGSLTYEGKPMTNRGVVYYKTLSKMEDALKQAGYTKI